MLFCQGHFFPFFLFLFTGMQGVKNTGTSDAMRCDRFDLCQDTCQFTHPCFKPSVQMSAQWEKEQIMVLLRKQNKTRQNGVILQIFLLHRCVRAMRQMWPVKSSKDGVRVPLVTSPRPVSSSLWNSEWRTPWEQMSLPSWAGPQPRVSLLGLAFLPLVIINVSVRATDGSFVVVRNEWRMLLVRWLRSAQDHLFGTFVRKGLL